MPRADSRQDAGEGGDQVTTDLVIAAAEFIEFAVENGILVVTPVWDSHQHANDWMSVISIDSLCPGGIGQRFLPKAKGDNCYLIDSLHVGDAVVLSGDVTFRSSGTARVRWFGFVRSISDTIVVLEQADTAGQAIKLAQPIRQKNIEDEIMLRNKQQADLITMRQTRRAAERPAKLIRQRDALLVRLAKIEQEIAASKVAL